MSIRVRLLALPALLAAGLCLFNSSASGQGNPKDLLNRAQSDQAALTSRLDGKMRDALAEARKLQATSPVRAANALKLAIGQLDDPLVPAAFRSEWTTQMTAQIRAIESGRKVADPVDVNPVKREIKDARVKEAKSIQEEYYDVRRSVDTISALIKAGATVQAQKEADALAKRYPNNPVVITMNDNIAWNQRLADAKDYVEAQKQGYLLAMRNVDRAAIPPKEDLEFDAEYFKRISKLRMKPELTKKETAILKALDAPITLGFKDTPFEDIIKFISTQMGTPILLDKAALAEAMLQSNTAVSVNLPPSVATRTALRKLLQEHGLTFVIKEETLQIVTMQQAKSMMVTRVYPIGDIVRMVGPLGGAVTFGPWMDAMATQEAAKQIVQMVQQIDPNSWKEAGGNGTIAFHWPTLSLIVRQTTEVHAKLGGLSR
jgi:hypothetical protein